MRLIRCASTTPPPPKLTVRAAFPGNAPTTHVRTVSGSAPRSARARSRTSPGLSIGRFPEVAELDETVDDARRAFPDDLPLRVDRQLRPERLLVGVGDPGELGDLARQGPAVQPLGVAANAFVERGFDVYLDERADLPPHLVADCSIRRDGGSDHDDPVPREQFGDVADATDVGVAVLAREAQALGEVLAHLVSVEHLNPDAPAAELMPHSRGERGLARSRQAGEPQREAASLGDNVSHASTSVASLHDFIQTKRARFPRGERARFVARAVYELLEHHPVPATKAPQPRPLPGERAHIRQSGQQLVVVWRMIIGPLFTARTLACQCRGPCATLSATRSGSS